MPYKADTEIDLTAQTTGSYIIASQHRKKGNPNKSIWTITFDEEVNCFIQALNGDWKIGKEAWGVKVIGDILQVVGLNNNRQELKLAKFVDGTNTNVWHGYPADYMSKAQDRPATNILKVWVDNGFLTKAKMSKIRLGQSCNL
ncbi:hypothetical protein [Aquirufa rosea]|uniref:Uncharacterized protein n=1 Tax=Aquirufa rosea TaxID=2509241 RepID=A0A4V1M574_9BACT|nr:hypothetical protein [Aquirufa rosea]RXK47062.1 hypothetical protein ESB04_10700 [Aquirufa rosea]